MLNKEDQYINLPHQDKINNPNKYNKFNKHNKHNKYNKHNKINRHNNHSSKESFRVNNLHLMCRLGKFNNRLKIADLVYK